MKRGIWLAAAALVVIVAGVTLVALPKGPEWTTSSPEALAEFEAAMDAEMKLYVKEAQAHVIKAYELDPDFALAKLMYSDVIRKKDKELAQQLWEEVLATDTSKLNPRERFFIERSRAYHDERSGDAVALLDEYVEKYPNDPFILNQKAVWTFHLGDLEEAERLYRRLAEISPNWVIAYNQLGYITMRQGRFTEAEEYFKSYRFIAPDQANPYDSLGELFITLGRYDEAEDTLEKALEIKSDFWAPYQHLALMKTFNGDLDGAREIVERAKAADIGERMVFNMDCEIHYVALRNDEAWQQIIDECESKCSKGFKEGVGFAVVTTHLAAAELGDWDLAKSYEDETAELLQMVEESGDSKGITVLKGALAHMQGIRLAIQGDYAAAADRLREADAEFTFGEAGTGLFKLHNRMILVETLLAEGKDAEAHQLLANARGVNPTMVAEFEESGLKVLGLARG